jgi:hypothetical protein
MSFKNVLAIAVVALLVLPVAWWLAGMGLGPAEAEALAATSPEAPSTAARHSTKASGPATSASGSTAGALTGDREETARFIRWYTTIELTPEQEAVRVEALAALPAPCCKEFTADECCCPCNMAKATWGLAKHLIAVEGKGVEEVRSTVAAWHHAINPDGYAGDSCATGKCNLPFRHEGCGGMDARSLVF